MHSKSVRIIAITVAALLFGVVTDRVSSHKLSSLAVSAFDGAIGIGIELVAPAVEPVAGRQRAAGTNSAPSLEPIARLQSPALAEASAIQVAEPESTKVDGAVASAEPQIQPDHTVASSLFEQPANASVRAGRAPSSPSSGGGGGAGSGGVPGGSSRETSAAAAETSESEPPAARLDGLMDLVMSELDSDGSHHTESGGISSDFKKSDFETSSATKPKATTAASSPSGSSPSGSSTSKSLPADSTKSPAVEQPSGSIPVAPYSPTLLSDVVINTGGSEFALDPADSLTQLVSDVLPPSSEGGGVEFIQLSYTEPMLSVVAPVLTPDLTLAVAETPMIVNPEPATLLLFGTGLALVALRVRRRGRRGLQ